MKRALVTVLFGCLALGLTSFAVAGNNYEASIAVHIGSGTAKSICDSVGPLTSATVVSDVNDGFACSNGYYNLYILVCNGSSVGGFEPEGSGVAGVELGIAYDSTISLGNSEVCSDLTFPSLDWPNSGSGAIFTWDGIGNCQSTPTEPFVPNTTIAVATGFEVFTTGPGAFSITPRPITGLAKVADCNAAEDDLTGRVPSHLGVAGFCGPGYNPCGLPTPVEESTWGAIKKQFGN